VKKGKEVGVTTIIIKTMKEIKETTNPEMMEVKITARKITLPEEEAVIEVVEMKVAEILETEEIVIDTTRSKINKIIMLEIMLINITPSRMITINSQGMNIIKNKEMININQEEVTIGPNSKDKSIEPRITIKTLVNFIIKITSNIITNKRLRMLITIKTPLKLKTNLETTLVAEETPSRIIKIKIIRIKSTSRRHMRSKRLRFLHHWEERLARCSQSTKRKLLQKKRQKNNKL